MADSNPAVPTQSASMSTSAEASKQGTEKTAEEQANEAQLQRLQAWTEKAFPGELHANSKSAFLHQFTETQLREGLIYAATARKTLLAEGDELFTIYNDRYATESHKQTFQAVNDSMAQAAAVKLDGMLLIKPKVWEAQDHGAAIRGWKNRTEESDQNRLRYTIHVVSWRNDKMRWQIVELKRAIAVAQGQQGGKGSAQGGAGEDRG